jgi:hypothetical protein
MSGSHEPQEAVAKTQRDKEVAFYSALVQAWIGTKMERDKTLVTLSAGGIGLLVTLLTTVGVTFSWGIWLYAGALLSFLTTIATSVVVFDRNSKHIEDLIHQPGSRDSVLKRLDKVSLWSFVIAALFAIAIGISSAVIKNSTEKEERKMAKEPTVSQAQGPLKKSLEGLGRLNPGDSTQRSLEGSDALRPQAPQPATPAQPAQATPTADSSESPAASSSGSPAPSSGEGQGQE